ncbi:MAG: hypothetical protein KAI79_17195 [Bacteroidales bacterium]|nr:hypothetical protein [Bacteroidales bacterium]
MIKKILETIETNEAREILLEKETYKQYFDKKLKKYGVKSAAELDKKEKKKFFDEVDAGWEGDNEND